jgi:hypothetical protein
MRTGVPAGVCATALPTRFVTTCRSRASSPITGALSGGPPPGPVSVTGRDGSSARTSE